jgi:DNA-binding MarR family transcriptional regulator
MYVWHMQIACVAHVFSGRIREEFDVTAAPSADCPNAGAHPNSPHSFEELARLDRAFLRLRRLIFRPETQSIPIPSLGRTVDLAKVMACVAIAEGPEIVGLDHAPTVKDIAMILELEHSTASRMLTEAEADGLVVRSTDPSDRRRTIVELTEDGRALLADSQHIRTWAIGGVLAEWNPSEVAQLSSLLERLVTTFNERMPQLIDQAFAEFAEAQGNEASQS